MHSYSVAIQQHNSLIDLKWEELLALILAILRVSILTVYGNLVAINSRIPILQYVQTAKLVVPILTGDLRAGDKSTIEFQPISGITISVNNLILKLTVTSKQVCQYLICSELSPLYRQHHVLAEILRGHTQMVCRHYKQWSRLKTASVSGSIV